ncbi:MAG: hypothetical protein NC489_42240 [Ruminococcus flavefaciens]|nr:hypothetical protein [Ruminococcus flavefaciens]
MKNLILSSIFTGGQLAFIIILAILVLAAIGVNVLFGFMWQMKAERAMHNADLRSRREALLDKIQYLNSGGAAEPQSWTDFAFFGEDDEEPQFGDEPVIAGTRPMNTLELKVGDMAQKARIKIGLRSKVFDNKRYYVRYHLGFDAKLCLSENDTKDFYARIADEFASYEGITIENEFGYKRVLFGKETVAKLTFIGKKLAAAFALDPKKYEGSKFAVEDKSDKRNFAKTPLAVCLESEENLADARQLISALADEKSFVRGAEHKGKYDLVERTRDDMIARDWVRVSLVSEII